MAPSEGHIYLRQLNLDFHKEMARKYMPVKKDIINEANKIWKKLLKNSKNVLGVLGRGTDFINLRPSGHSIPPPTEKMIKDTKKIDKKNNYDWISLATEDNNIRNKFIQEFGDKLKMIQIKNIEYNGGYLSDYRNVHGIEFQKLYLLSILILSKSLDVILSRCSGAMGAYIFSEGFRESLVYFLGDY